MITGPSGPTMDQLFGKPETDAPEVEAAAVLPDGVIDALADGGYFDLEEIAAADDNDLLALPGIGPATLIQIRETIG